MIPGITPRQKQTLDFIAGYMRVNDYAPSYEEIRIGIGASSKGQIRNLVNLLVEKGALRRLDRKDLVTGKSKLRYRGLQLVNPENYNPANCPHCGQARSA